MKITDEEIVANILRFNKELMELNIKYSEEIEELKLELQDTNSQLADISKRCIKAIKYIKNNEKEYGSLEDNEKIILDILKGSDKE